MPGCPSGSGSTFDPARPFRDAGDVSGDVRKGTASEQVRSLMQVPSSPRESPGRACGMTRTRRQGAGDSGVHPFGRPSA